MAKVPEKPLRPSRKLRNVTEQHVLKTGILQLYARLAEGKNLERIEVPLSASGVPKVMQGSALLIRLLKEEVELKGCLESDVSAAQWDVRHLSPEQLIAIRSRTLTFATESASHSAHQNFLETVDKHLFQKLSLRCLRGPAALPARVEPLHALGLRLALILGATKLLADGWGPQGDAAKGLPDLPCCWVLPLVEQEWPDRCKAAMFHTNDLWLEALQAEAPDFAGLAGGGNVALVCDRTTGVGKDRMLFWEIIVLDPSVDNILEELAEVQAAAQQPQSKLTHELSEQLAKRADTASLAKVLQAAPTRPLVPHGRSTL